MKKELIGVAALLFLAAVCMFPVSAQEEAVISDGVFIGEKDVSGMTAEEAEAYVESEVAALAASTITLRMGDAEVTSTWADLGLTWTNKDLVQEISELGTTGNIVRRYKELKDLENQSANYKIEYALNEKAEEAFVHSLAAFNSEPAEGSICQDDDGTLRVEGGTDGLTLDADATLVSLKKYLAEEKAGDVVIEATADAEPPQLTASLLGRMTDVLGTASTDYSASSEAWKQNVENGTELINGTLLKPGESFSVTDAVTPFTAGNGYTRAPSCKAGEADSYSGGICQVATTLYNAVLESELEVNQRFHHTVTVSYAEPLKDAAIEEDSMDLVFTNDLDNPVYIVGNASEGTVTFTIYGIETRAANRSIQFVTEVLSQTDAPSAVTLRAVATQSVGYLLQIQTAQEGVHAVLWKQIYYDGVLADMMQEDSSTYSAAPAFYEVGVFSENEELYSAMMAAVESNDLSAVESLIADGMPQKEAGRAADDAGTGRVYTDTDNIHTDADFGRQAYAAADVWEDMAVQE